MITIKITFSDTQTLESDNFGKNKILNSAKSNALILLVFFKIIYIYFSSYFNYWYKYTVTLNTVRILKDRLPSYIYINIYISTLIIAFHLFRMHHHGHLVIGVQILRDSWLKYTWNRQTPPQIFLSHKTFLIFRLFRLKKGSITLWLIVALCAT